MKLNADIIFAGLQDVFPAELHGFHRPDLTIQRPEFYVDSWSPMLSGHFYILPQSEFPQNLKLEPGCIILCCDHMPVPHHLLDKSCVIRLKQKNDPFTVMNVLTQIFDRYTQWFEKLHQIVETTADISEMTDITSQILRNPVMVLDSEFRYLTTAGYDDAKSSGKNGSSVLSFTALNQYLETTDMELNVTDPIHLKLQGHEVLSYNLFDAGEYAGSVTIEYRNRPYNPGDKPLIRLFAHYLMLAMRQHFQLLSSGHSLLRKSFRTLLEGLSLTAEDQDHLKHMNLPEHWRCMVLQPCQKLSQVPASYVCDQLESKLSECVAFPYKNAIAAFLHAESPINSTSSRENFIQDISGKLETENFKIGVSSLFSDLSTVPWHYKQSIAALENGRLFDPDWTFYFFEEYALDELIINSTGDEPLEMYYSDGLKKLFEHDASSSTSYIDTLRTYLNNNMNVTATAEQLYIHRSTLMERLTRIKRELWDDLSDPDIQLRLRIILKSLELRGKEQQQNRTTHSD